MTTMVLNAADFLADQASYSLEFQNAFMESESYWDRVAMGIPTNKAQQKFAWNQMLASVREFIGERQIKSLKLNTNTIEVDKYELTLGLSVDDIEDDNTGLFRLAVAQMGENFSANRDEAVWDYLTGDAWTSTDTYDGVAHFSTAHPQEGGGTQANMAAATALDADAFDAMYLRLEERENDWGRRISLPSQRLFICGPSNRAAIEAILKVQQISDGTTTITNRNYERMEFVIVPRITGTHYFMMSVGRIKPVAMLQRYPQPQFSAQDQPTDDRVFIRDEVAYGGKDRFGVGPGLWHFIEGNEGA